MASLIALMTSTLVVFSGTLLPISIGAFIQASLEDWDNDGVVSQDWAESADHNWGHQPAVTEDNPFIYRYQAACAETTPGKPISCGVGEQVCTEAEGGKLVDWYRSLKPPSPVQWTLISRATCIYSEKPIDILAEIAAQISHEFQKSPVQAATVGSQPGPHTLRGNETNFYADAAEQEFNIILLGQKVHITATPVAYTWDYGDGNSWGPSSSSGFPLPDDRVGEQTNTSHVYIATGKYAIAVTTHFNGSYSVNGGPTLPIPEQGHIASGPLGLTVWRAITRNYADDCNTNPAGEGC
ncbi:PKD domain-containing protein [Arthrobacter cryoconiti]|uniref:PKD domain-containing protein n=1 Tax=Arthrobacter cryoconiti TaxID=748907 RepID=A0ABV8QW87_9MICC|nr:PKD domain-containing protein [Arthrobacter cryoconiti]MCC9068873.1 PKD domain-containing protein [Arthrobacter cryoconiti]